MENEEFDKKIEEYISENLKVKVDSFGGFGWAKITVSLWLKNKKISQKETEFYYE